MIADSEKIIRILILEEDQLILMGIKSFLQQETAFQVIHEPDGNRLGLEQIHDHKPDVVITEMGLPEMDGIEITRQIKRFNPDIKVIILTSSDDEEEILAALAAGADAYCLKNLVSDQLPFIIRCVYGGGAWLDPSIARKVVRLVSTGQLLISPHGDPDNTSREAASNQDRLGLTERERKILGMIVEGQNNAEIAQHLHISYHTVKSDVTNILQKLAVDDRVQAAVKALRENLV